MIHYPSALQCWIYYRIIGFGIDKVQAIFKSEVIFLPGTRTSFILALSLLPVGCIKMASSFRVFKSIQLCRMLQYRSTTTPDKAECLQCLKTSPKHLKDSPRSQPLECLLRRRNFNREILSFMKLLKCQQNWQVSVPKPSSSPSAT